MNLSFTTEDLAPYELPIIDLAADDRSTPVSLPHPVRADSAVTITVTHRDPGWSFDVHAAGLPHGGIQYSVASGSTGCRDH